MRLLVASNSRQTSCRLIGSGKLADKFGDNGLVSNIIGRIEGDTLHLDLWLMSSRVLKRNLEEAMLDVLVSTCKARNVSRIFGYYFKTAKNSMVADLYDLLGFKRTSGSPDEDGVWRLEVSDGYVAKNRFIKVLDEQ